MTETRIIDGKEQTCVIIPVEDNQLSKSSWGKWIMSLKMYEVPPNPKGLSHKLALQWRDKEALNEAHKKGLTKKTANIGCATSFNRERHKEKSDSNASQEELEGIIILSDVPKNRIFKNRQTAKRFIPNLKLKSLLDDGMLWTGVLSIDEIPKHYILEYPDSGKKYIKVKFKKLKKTDVFMNTHILVLDSQDGSQIEVGRFREWKKQGEVIKNETPSQEIHDTPVNQRTPESIDGLKF